MYLPLVAELRFLRLEVCPSRCVLTKAQIACCCVSGCGASACVESEHESLCLGHYLEGSMRRLHVALADSREGATIGRKDLDQLAKEADFAVRYLASGGMGDLSSNRERMIEIVLGVANLNDRIRRNPSFQRN